jgi:hypothetical protein
MHPQLTLGTGGFIVVSEKSTQEASYYQLKTCQNMTSLENWLWEAAFEICGEVDAPKYKDYIPS